MPTRENAFEKLLRIGSRRAIWLGVPLLLYAWTLVGPFAFDDLILVLKAEHYLAGETAEPDLFRFAADAESWQVLRDRGTYPWWSPDQNRIDFFRPLAEWSFVLDMKLFGRNPFAHRLVSLGLFVVVLLLAHRLFRTATRDDARSAVATFFFGISQTMTQPVTFICNRSDLLVLIGVLIGATAYWQAIVESPDANATAQSHRVRWRLVLLATAGFVFALAAKEIAVAFAGVVVLHEIITRWRGKQANVDHAARTSNRTRSIIAFCVFMPALAYLAYYAATRPGLSSSGMEGGGRWSYLIDAPQAVLLYLSVWTLGFPISLLLQAEPRYVAVVVGLSLIALAVLARNLRRACSQSSASLFFCLWALLFMLPGTLTTPETRVLSIASLGWAFILARVLCPPADTKAAPIWIRHWLLATNGVVSMCCAVGSVLFTNTSENQARAQMQSYVAALDTPLADGDVLIVAESASPLEFACAGDRLEYLTRRRELAFAFLTDPKTNADIRRIDDHTLRVEVEPGKLLGSRLHRLILGEEWLPQRGACFTLNAFTARIADVTPDGEITAIDFEFAEPLASRRLHFYPRSLNETARGD